MPAASPVMTAESESNMLIEARPVRVSGWLALLLGLISSMTLFTLGFLVFAALAIAVGLYAIRGYSGLRPIGYRSAVAGILLAVLFSAWALAENQLRTRYMLRYGNAFAADWLALVQGGQIELACELLNGPAQRQDPSMPLKPYYQESANGKTAMASFREHSMYNKLIEAGNRAQFTSIRPPQYRSFGNRHMVDTFWSDPSGTVADRFALTIEYYAPRHDGEQAQWGIQGCNEMRPEN